MRFSRVGTRPARSPVRRSRRRLSTIGLCPCGHTRMTRGRRGSLHLRRTNLSFTAPRRAGRRTVSPLLLDVGDATGDPTPAAPDSRPGIRLPESAYRTILLLCGLLYSNHSRAKDLRGAGMVYDSHSTTLEPPGGQGLPSALGAEGWESELSWERVAGRQVAGTSAPAEASGFRPFEGRSRG